MCLGNEMTLELKVTGLDGVIDTLEKLPPEIVSKRGGPVKLALKRAALVIRAEVAKNLKERLSPDKTGLVEKSLVATRGKQNLGFNGERYVVRFKKLKYKGRTDGGRKDGELLTIKTIQLFEYGSIKQRARKPIRDAARAKAQESVDTFSKELGKEIAKVVKKLNSGIKVQN